jgi:hypothetical protein
MRRLMTEVDKPEETDGPALPWAGNELTLGGGPQSGSQPLGAQGVIC